MLYSNSTDLIRKASIEELAAHRNRSIECMRQAIDMVHAANKAAKLAAPSVTYAGGAGISVTSKHIYDCRGALENFTRTLDRQCWTHMLGATGIRSIMGSRQVKEFEALIEKEPPAFTVENARATFLDKIENSGAIFAQSVVDCFERSPKSFKSNDAFKIGARIIYDYAVSSTWNGERFYWAHSYSNGRQYVRDLDRIMHILDGKAQETDATAIAAAEMDAGNLECETDYFRFRFFKKGTAHIYPKRPDLVERMNKVLASHYGATLAKAS